MSGMSINVEASVVFSLRGKCAILACPLVVERAVLGVYTSLAALPVFFEENAMYEIETHGPVVHVDTTLINAMDRIGVEGFALYCVIIYAYNKHGVLPRLEQLDAFCRRVETIERVDALLVRLRDEELLTREELDTIGRVHAL